MNVLSQLSIVLQIFYLFIQQFFIASAKLMWTIYFRHQNLESEIFAIPLSTETFWCQLVIAHFVTLTPGTLSIEIQTAEKMNAKILVHSLDRRDRLSLIHLIVERLEPQLKKLSGEIPL